MKKTIIQSARLILLAVIFSLGLGIAFAWTGPQSSPPPTTGSVNVSAPLNTGSVDQVKAGGIWVNALVSTNGLIVQNGNIKTHANTPEGTGLEIYNDSKSASDKASYWAIHNMTGNYGNKLSFWPYNNNPCVGGIMCAPVLDLWDNGNVTTPLNTAFEAGFISGTINAGAYIVWNNILSNIGSNYNNSNGLYTAPVAGMYVFGFNILLPNAGTGEYRYEFWKNGARYNGIIKTKTVTGWDTIQGTITTHLNAGETMGIRYNQGTGAAYPDGQYNRFWGYLQG